MKQLVIFAALLSLKFSVIAQEKNLTLEDALVNNRTTLAPANLRQLQFVYNSPAYVYLGKDGTTDVWKRGEFSASSEQIFLTLKTLNDKLRSNGMDTVKAMPAIQFNQSNEWIMNVNGNKIAINPVNNVARILIPKSISQKEHVEESKAGFVAYVDDDNLFVKTATSTKQVTTDGSKDIVYASTVHREEFGIVKGTFWSPDGNKLAFYRMDQHMVTDYPIIDWTERPAKNVNIKYPMAGDSSHWVTIGVYDVVADKLIYLQTGEPRDHYLTNIVWTPDNSKILVAELNRGQDDMKLNVYDAHTGAFLKTLFEEKDEKYVEPLVPALFLPNGSGDFIWQSNRDGWNHLYLYSADGKTVRQLTQGAWEVLEVKGFDSKGENLFYSATKESPLNRNLYSVNIKTAISRRITTGEQVHGTQVSTDGRYVIDNYSFLDNPRTIQIIELKTGKIKQIFQAPNPLADFHRGKLSVFSIPGENGVPLYCRQFLPVGFDSTKKYPVIVYWYGGSHVQLVGNNWNGNAGDYWFQYMAERGYVVFSIDVRGSDNRGKAFEQAMFRRLGDVQMNDLMRGVNYLKSKPWVDAANMGLFGWSFGGFLTTDFMLTHPGVFKTAVAGGPVIDWSYYEVMYTERYMDTPQTNPEGYAATDLTKKIGNLKGKLLLIHGLQDDVVVQQHSVRLVREAITKNVQVDYMIYPGHQHNVLGSDRAHLYQKVTDYFNDHLQGGTKLGF